MIKNEIKLKDLRWVDIIEPNKEELTSVSKDFSVPLNTLLTCLDPEHLPKYDLIGETAFLIIRIYDASKNLKADTVQDLTTKLGIVISPQAIITIHRLDQIFLKDLRSKLNETILSKELIKEIIHQSIMSFDQPLNDLEHQTDLFEQSVFLRKNSARVFQQGYLLKRKASIFRKMLKLSADIINKLVARDEYSNFDFQNLRNSMNTLLFYTDDALENVTSLLNLHLSITSQKTNEASYKTNEVMRILTVFSIFFLPLNFIAGLYGMNFEHMPELKNPNGYYLVLVAMLIISTIIFIWIYKRGWIKGIEGDHK